MATTNVPRLFSTKTLLGVSKQHPVVMFVSIPLCIMFLYIFSSIQSGFWIIQNQWWLLPGQKFTKEINEIKARLANINWETELATKSTNEAFGIFHDKLTKIIDMVAPEKMIFKSNKKPSVPWYMLGIKRCNEKEKRLYKCTSSNLIYLIQCKLCNMQYVGQTRNKIVTRLNQHYSTIRTAQETPVSRHFRSHQCKEPYPVRIYILSLIKADNAQELRNKWERIWMARLSTYVPYGMNIQD